MKVGERIAARLEALGGRADGYSQAWLARAVGISQPTINALIRRPETGSKHLYEIAKALGTTVSYLLGETDDPGEDSSPSSPLPVAIERLGLVMIPEIDITYSMGGGSIVEGVNTRRVPFRKDWLRRLTRGEAANVFLARGRGDSMMPTILDDDDVLVNKSEASINDQDRIWALGYGELGMIKRVRRLPSGRFQLNSDNSNVTPIEAVEDELHVVGRVIWIGRRV